MVVGDAADLADGIADAAIAVNAGAGGGLDRADLSGDLLGRFPVWLASSFTSAATRRAAAASPRPAASIVALSANDWSG